LDSSIDGFGQREFLFVGPGHEFTEQQCAVHSDVHGGGRGDDSSIANTFRHAWIAQLQVSNRRKHSHRSKYFRCQQWCGIEFHNGCVHYIRRVLVVGKPGKRKYLFGVSECFRESIQLGCWDV